MLVGDEGRIFTSSEPFSNPHRGAGHRGRQASRRPKTVLVVAENFWNISGTRHRRLRARFHFYSLTQTSGFECKRDLNVYADQARGGVREP